MKKKKVLLFIFLTIPLFLSAIENNDSITKNQNQIILHLEENEKAIESLKTNFSVLKLNSENQGKLYEQTNNSISTQLDAASYNLSVFGILFAIAAIILGVYITFIERKVVQLREQNKSLLEQTIKNKEEVVEINNLIQKDIYGLFIKIKREETVQMLNRLLNIPEDISNLSKQLITRELERTDFYILKKAYLSLDNRPQESLGFIELRLPKKDLYKLIFFQHFLDLAIKDEQISNDLIDFFPTAINCAFENDMIKSTEDFIKAIIELGYQSRRREINGFIAGLSNSNYKNLSSIYEILFKGFSNRDDKFKFFDLISDDSINRVGKSNYGKIIISSYSSTELSPSEKTVIGKTHQIIDELQKEEQENERKKEKEKEIF